MKPSWQKQGEALQNKLNQIPQKDLERELQKQILSKFVNFFSVAPSFYLDLNKYQRSAENIPAIWQQGSSKLFEYIPSHTSNISPILMVPSLINRHYILDLEENNSFVKYLMRNNIPTYLASWGEPEKSELHFTIDDYISRVCQMIDMVSDRTGKKVILSGYCMGGLLSLSAAMARHDKIKAISFMATPWNFHSPDFPRFTLNDSNLNYTKSFLGRYEKIPAELIQAVFYYLHAHSISQKFEMYPILTQEHPQKGYLAIENWINDGISMTQKAAMESFIDWVNDNVIANLQWNSLGKIIDPKDISDLPSFFAIPKKDSIVPPSCALGLTEYFPNCKVIMPNTGHIGMMVGSRAQKQTWDPFINWVKNLMPPS